jgi:hypothetical protein
MKTAVFWVVVPFILVDVYDVSEVLAASIIRAFDIKFISYHFTGISQPVK